MNNRELNVDKLKKIMIAKPKGTYTIEDAKQAIIDYQNTIKSIDPKQYTLEIDCQELNVTAPDTVPMLEKCFEMYNETGFKKIEFIVLEDSPIIKMQLGRIARKTNLSNYEIIIK